MTITFQRTAGLAVVAGALIFSGVTLAQTPSSSADQTMDKSKSGMSKGADSKFVMEAAQGGMTEVKLGQLAATNATNPDVKQFGQRMVDDHTKANDQLKSIASQAGMTLPSDIGAKNQAMYDHLSKLSGAAFDKAYMQHMVADHKKDVAEFQKESNSGKDQAVKGFASTTLPTLQEHLRMAQEVNGKVSGSSSSTSADRMKDKNPKQ